MDPLTGCPIVTGTNSLTHYISTYFDHVPRPFVTSLPSYVRDSMEVIKKIDDLQVEPDVILASLDVEALYSSINLVLILLIFFLEHNMFLFDGQIYHHTRSVAMGSPCAPTYANLFLGGWEREVVFGDSTRDLSSSIMLWLRYIDDVPAVGMLISCLIH